MKRQALHAFELGFVHPDTGKELRFTAPIPGDMQAAIDAIDAVEKSLG
jgi:23S rRNA pseudouridine1911/1915/1917 synthase